MDTRATLSEPVLRYALDLSASRASPLDIKESSMLYGSPLNEYSMFWSFSSSEVS